MLYKTAIELICSRGYEATTLRDVSERAGVSPGLLYKYFASKRAVVLHLYDELSVEYATRAGEMPEGKWRDRFMFALSASLGVLSPHRQTLAALVPVLVGDPHQGLFAPETAFSRERVQAVFHRAITEAADAPRVEVGAAWGRLLYLAHLAIIMWWLLDKSPRQRATVGLLALVKQVLPTSAMTLRLRRVRRIVLAADQLLQEALFKETES
ncbi:MAG TPA: TetR/AcrR family transcriptional regulator [Terriglobales bacterium]|nr:TetR/AcrR family transcriptional regulator [Terriglobales bacterium]